MASTPEDRRRELGLIPPAPPPALAHFELAVRTGSLLVLAGHASLREGRRAEVGTVGASERAGRCGAARLTALEMLARP